MRVEAEIDAWLRKVLAIDADEQVSQVDYLSIQRRQSARSWPQHARVNAHGRAPVDVVGEALEHVRDVAASADAEGRAGWAVRLLVYAPGAMQVGSRTFRPEHQPTEEEAGDIDDSTAQGSLVAAVRELRLLVVDQGKAMQAATGEGYRLAFKALEQAQQLQAENAQLLVAVATAQAEAEQSKGGMIEVAKEMLPAVLPALIAAGNAREMRAAAEAQAEAARAQAEAKRLEAPEVEAEAQGSPPESQGSDS